MIESTRRAASATNSRSLLERPADPSEPLDDLGRERAAVASRAACSTASTFGDRQLEHDRPLPVDPGRVNEQPRQ